MPTPLTTIADASDDMAEDEQLPALPSPTSLKSHGDASQRLRTAIESALGTNPDSEVPPCLGRFELLERLGEGAMGVVHRAMDLETQQVVAIKMLHPDLALRGDAARRFAKEARLLAAVSGRNVARLIRVGADCGRPFLVMEFAAGVSLARLVSESGRLSPDLALSIGIETARALTDLHAQGIVHRDVKPENILVRVAESTVSTPTSSTNTETLLQLWLTDFGLARTLDQTASLALTRSSAILGTPGFMAPEQFSPGATVNASADVYALGGTLFFLLSGRQPFESNDVLQLAQLHRHHEPARLSSLRGDVSEALSEIVARALQKRPEQRYRNGSELLADLERLHRGEAIHLHVHPLKPACDVSRLVRYRFEWTLASPPEVLWPLVSHTERLNRAIGLPAVKFTSDIGPSGELRRFGNIRIAGFNMRWREHSFEWIEGQRFGVLREFEFGPLSWFTSVVELHRTEANGTLLSHTFEIEPRGVTGRIFAAIKFGRGAKASLSRVYQRIDSVVSGSAESRALTDPFEPPDSESAMPWTRRSQQLRRADELLKELATRRVDQDALLRITEFIRTAAPQEAGRIRPRALARRLILKDVEVIRVCLHAVQVGLLELLWDIICPVCRTSSSTCSSVRTLPREHICEACQQEFETDINRNVELIVRAHPQVRSTETGVFCIGGPGHSPHVVAQLRVAAGEVLDLGLALAEGSYRMRGPQLPWQTTVRVRNEHDAERGQLQLDRSDGWQAGFQFGTGRQSLRLSNGFSHEVLLRIERIADREDCLSAAEAMATPLFRELFPQELISDSQLNFVTRITLVATNAEAIDFGGDGSLTLMQEHLQQLSAAARLAGGVWIKILGRGGLMAFSDANDARSFASRAAETVPTHDGRPAFRLRVAVHTGRAVISSINGQLDYLGEASATVLRRLQDCIPGNLIVSADA